ncbi:hypothetical protein FLL46_18775 [Aliikangiella coralliicola]|uniref:Uncharacterized protein n=2 Tax=Aliikangiella coralliicola TaxID=2592383 RepID=A0A545U9B6_9GAMM|nr:hypothetical protein FLL46_18775 [Aliikangiella coralliicola]
MASQENVDSTRTAVRDLLQKSAAYNELDEVKRRALANDLVQIGTYLAEPDGVRIDPSKQSDSVRALAEEGVRSRRTQQQQGDGEFVAQSAREGAAVAGALLEAVNFPEFVSGLIDGVFHSIVTSSIEQMEAYAKLVADVSKSLNQFRDENTTQNQGRDHLVESFPDIFELKVDTGEFGSDFGDFDGEGGEGSEQSGGPRVSVRSGIDQSAAVERINRELPLDQPVERLDDRLVEALLVPAARSQLASSRQQLLATTIMLGINRVVVTDGRIAAKVMYDFRARDNMKFRKSAQQFDYGDQQITTRSGNFEREGAVNRQGGSRGADGSYQGGSRNASFYSKGQYKNTSQPVLKLASASQTSVDASLQTRASLSGSVEVNFKSDYLPLEKLANPESIAAIQMNAQPGMVKNLANRPQPSNQSGSN